VEGDDPPKETDTARALAMTRTTTVQTKIILKMVEERNHI
jgi:hypothetical protein